MEGQGREPRSQRSRDRRVAQRIEGFSKTPPIDPEAVEKELEQVALAPAKSGREAMAKVTALRTLERLGRPAGADNWPVDDEGRFHPGPPVMWELDRYDSDEARERWRRAWGRRKAA